MAEIKKVLTTDVFNQYITEQVKPYVDAHGVKNITDATTTGGQLIIGALTQKIEVEAFTFTNEHSSRNGDTIITGATGQYSFEMNGKSAAEGKRSVAQGSQTIAEGDNSHAEGNNSIAVGNQSHAEGLQTCAGYVVNGTIIGNAAHAEGSFTQALEHSAHAEGYNTKASALAAHSEGKDTEASANHAHAEGLQTRALMANSHAEGQNTIANAYAAHAEGASNFANGNASHAGGEGSYAQGEATFASGYYVRTRSDEPAKGSMVIGRYNDYGDSAYKALFIVGNGTADDTRSNAFEVYQDGSAKVGKANGTETDLTVATKGYVDAHASATNIQNGTVNGALAQKIDAETFTFTNPYFRPAETITTGATGAYSFELGGKSLAEGKRSVSQGTQTIAAGDYSHAEGNNTAAVGANSHAEGIQTYASASASHAEGQQTQATGVNSHAEGYRTLASNDASHAAGSTTEATNFAAFAIGDHSQARGAKSFAGGQSSVTDAAAQNSFAFGNNALAMASDSFVVGKYNASDSNTLFAVGNGNSTTRQNAFEVYQDGHATVGAMGTTDLSVATKGYVDSRPAPQRTVIIEDLETVRVFDNNGEIKITIPSSPVLNDGDMVFFQLSSAEYGYTFTRTFRYKSALNVYYFNDITASADEGDVLTMAFIYDDNEKEMNLHFYDGEGQAIAGEKIDEVILYKLPY